MGKKKAPARNASKKAMQKKAARKKTLAKKASQRTTSSSGLGGTSGMGGMGGMGGLNLPGMNMFGINNDMMAMARSLDDQKRQLAAGPNKKRFAKNAQANEGVNYFLIKVTFTKTDTPVWRRLVLAADDPISFLHDQIQEAFGWDNDHMSVFCWDIACSKEFARTFEDPWTFEPDPQMREVLREGATIGYNYNFFQDFTHTITVEKAMVERYDYDPDLQMEQGKLSPDLPMSGILFHL